MSTVSTGFVGFPDIKMKAVVVPDFFFSDLLTQIDDLAELKLTLHCFWLLNEQEGELRYLRGDDLRTDAHLRQSLAIGDDLRPPATVLEDALERTTARNTLLKLEITTDMASGNYAIAGDVDFGDIDSSDVDFGDAEFDGLEDEASAPATITEDWYFMNTVKGRQMLAMIRQGRLNELKAVIPDDARLHVDRPNIFILYEQNVGLLTPLITDRLRDMEKTYPPEWIQDAFETAVAKNARNLKYIQAILKRWETHGRDIKKHEERGRDSAEQRSTGQHGEYRIPDEFSDIIIG